MLGPQANSVAVENLEEADKDSRKPIKQSKYYFVDHVDISPTKSITTAGKSTLAASRRKSTPFQIPV
jgi:hypothetical protein